MNPVVMDAMLCRAIVAKMYTTSRNATSTHRDCFMYMCKTTSTPRYDAHRHNPHLFHLYIYSSDSFVRREELRIKRRLIIAF